ncbi:MAG: SRPBCC family protein, partial [Thaumarchaeota archaeon]|nr:SRPBCC family protein [Nitrososphaerota archaeon]
MTVVSSSIDIKTPISTAFTYFARPEHVSDQFSETGVGMTVVPMDIKAGMGVGTTFRIIGDFNGKRLEWDCETTEFEKEERIAAKMIKGPFKRWEITTE